MGQKYLIDTNSLIDAQAMKLPEKSLTFLANAINEDFNVSFITYIEFLGYKDVTQANKDFINLATVIEINKEIIDTCIELRKKQRIKLPDAIIASTALAYNLTMLNSSHKCNFLIKQ
jgi:predicted nucleic acid-binding protein